MARPRKEPPLSRVTAADIIAFIEQTCVVPEGRLVGQPLKLMDWQKDLLRLIYSLGTDPAGDRQHGAQEQQDHDLGVPSLGAPLWPAGQAPAQQSTVLRRPKP